MQRHKQRFKQGRGSETRAWLLAFPELSEKKKPALKWGGSGRCQGSKFKPPITPSFVGGPWSPLLLSWTCGRCKESLGGPELNMRRLERPISLCEGRGPAGLWGAGCRALCQEGSSLVSQTPSHLSLHILEQTPGEGCGY